MLYSTLFASALMATTCVVADPQPYTNIRNMAYVPYYLENGYLLSNVINMTSATVFIDVNSQNGSAARYVAQTTQDVTCYAVNAWWSCDTSQKYLFQRFLSNVKQENTAERIIPLRMASYEASHAINVVAEVIYIGTNPNLGTDILAWFPHLSSNGVICGHDWEDPSVEVSISQAATKLGCQIHSDGNFWYLQKGL